VSEAEVNKALVRRFMEARAKANLDAIQEMMAPDFISHGLLPGQQPDRSTFRNYTHPELRFHVLLTDEKGDARFEM
jgi:ketosteroid isomerase-like protein